MKANTWMPLYVADYDRKTSRLSLSQDGAYLRILRDYWTNGAPPDDDDVLARIVRIERREWLKIRPAIVGFFDVRDGSWFQKRAEEEIARARSLSEARAVAGAKGGRPRKETESNSKPIAFGEDKLNETPALVAPPSPLPPPSEVKDLEASLPAATDVAPVDGEKPKTTKKQATQPIWLADPTFTAAWNACTDTMRKRSESREKTWPVWRVAAAKAGGAEGLLSALLGYLRNDEDVKRTGGPGFHLWLKEGRWEHWLGGEGGSSAFDLASYDAERARLTAELEQQEIEA